MSMFRVVARVGALMVALVAIGVLSGLAACSTSAPQRWYRMSSEPPPGESARRAVDGVVVGAVWALASSLPMPELLERDTLLVEEGSATIRMLHGHRWAEPLRDTLPRLLRQDLARFVPGLWTGQAAPGAPAAGLVQVELLALQGSLSRRQVLLSARWSVQARGLGDDTVARPLKRTYQMEELVPWTNPSPETLVMAQRLAMWRLAGRIAQSLPQPDAAP
jgi:uncharacterized protein